MATFNRDATGTFGAMAVALGVAVATAVGLGEGVDGAAVATGVGAAVCPGVAGWSLVPKLVLALTSSSGQQWVPGSSPERVLLPWRWPLAWGPSWPLRRRGLRLRHTPK